MAPGLEDLFRAHWSLVHGYLTRRTGDAVVAEELAQETFYRATRAFLGWRGGSAVARRAPTARNRPVPQGPPSGPSTRRIRWRLTRRRWSRRHDRARRRSVPPHVHRDHVPLRGKRR